MRQIALDTETTGLDPEAGHRVIEIAAVELVNRRLTERYFHCYLNPERPIDSGAQGVHGLSDQFLADKPRFGEVAEAFLEFIEGAELLIHNAPFDVGFLDMELSRAAHGSGLWPNLNAGCSIVDTLLLARERHPGQRNSLDALCKRYSVDASERDVHGALIDARLLAQVYLAMTGGQTRLALGQEQLGDHVGRHNGSTSRRPVCAERRPLPVLRASAAEAEAHRARLQSIAKTAKGEPLWLTIFDDERPPTA